MALWLIYDDATLHVNVHFQIYILRCFGLQLCKSKINNTFDWIYNIIIINIVKHRKLWSWQIWSLKRKHCINFQLLLKKCVTHQKRDAWKLFWTLKKTKWSWCRGKSYKTAKAHKKDPKKYILKCHFRMGWHEQWYSYLLLIVISRTKPRTLINRLVHCKTVSIDWHS